MIKIGKTKIGIKHKPYVIAEMSGNHNQSLDNAIKIVESAASCGADAIKLQTYKPETITLDAPQKDFFINEKNNLWKGNSLFNLYKKAHTPWEWHEPIINAANDLGISCFSSPFDETSVEFLSGLDVPAYKIASFEIVHIPLLKKVASQGKPVIISTGLANVSEINEAITVLKENGCDDILLLKCTSNYPANPRDSDILTIPHMRDLFNCEVGVSDHTEGIGVPLTAVAHGASVIEKHFTLDTNEKSVDSDFSINPNQLKMLVEESKRAWLSLGSVKYGPNKSELNSLKYRRSIYISKDIKRGETFTKKNIKVVRPSYGLHPRFFEMILGKKSKSDFNIGTPLKMDMVY